MITLGVVSTHGRFASDPSQATRIAGGGRIGWETVTRSHSLGSKDRYLFDHLGAATRWAGHFVDYGCTAQQFLKRGTTIPAYEFKDRHIHSWSFNVTGRRSFF